MHSVANIDRGAVLGGKVAVPDQRLVVDAMPAVGAVVAPQPSLDDIFAAKRRAEPTG
jgi:hypothetical protein